MARLSQKAGKTAPALGCRRATKLLRKQQLSRNSLREQQSK
jgi:hypothetical protein